MLIIGLYFRVMWELTELAAKCFLWAAIASFVLLVTASVLIVRWSIKATVWSARLSARLLAVSHQFVGQRVGRRDVS